MHIFFSGIGGTAIGPLALIAKEAGFNISGSDKQDSQYIKYLKSKGLGDIHIGQTYEQISAAYDKNPIDWYVYSSAVAIENPDADELRFCRDNQIKISKRDELLNEILKDKKLDLVAIAGTHGKTTTTAMVIWLLKQLGLVFSYSVGAKIDFGDMGQYQPGSKYFVYEADEFDRNFLAFEPHLSLITGVTWDHHEVFPTREDYQQAFKEFINQCKLTVMWQEDFDYLNLQSSDNISVQDSANTEIEKITLKGLYNRLDAWLAIKSVHQLTKAPIQQLIEDVNKFPGSQRRMEEIVPNLFSDYAHTPEKIRGAMSVALEMANDKNQSVVVVYEPLTDRRQHYMIEDYQDCFDGAAKIYWLPSYLAREDPNQEIMPPEELIRHLSDPSKATPYKRDQSLVEVIKAHLAKGDMVVGMAGGGGGSLDEWLRQKFDLKD
jgi:UDP-N-acetylmuramate--alanine ligase